MKQKETVIRHAGKVVSVSGSQLKVEIRRRRPVPDVMPERFAEPRTAGPVLSRSVVRTTAVLP